MKKQFKKTLADDFDKLCIKSIKPGYYFCLDNVVSDRIKPDSVKTKCFFPHILFVFCSSVIKVTQPLPPLNYF